MKPQPLNLEKLIRKIEDDLLNRDSEISDEMDALDERLMDTIQFYTDAVVSKTIEHTVNIVRQRIKSAVEDLLEEIRQKKIDTAKLQNPEEIISMTKKELANEVNIEIDEILSIIKKWFLDILWVDENKS